MNALQTDTIAAITTAPGESAISIVRMSGSRSIEIADRLFHGSKARPSQCPHNTFLHGCVHGPPGARPEPKECNIDEVIMLVFRAPHSYTREDVVEIQCHGGSASARRIIAAVLDAGVRPAEPGEFTKRAFLNGRIDLLKAEAVLDLIRARSDRAAAAAVEQLDGSLTRSFSETYDVLLSAATDIQASLDFDKDELPSPCLDRIKDMVCRGLHLVDDLLASWHDGRLMREGVVVVILGRPNAGKSTLFNRLFGTDRVIVSHIPGTTRDFIEETIVIAGVPVRLIDTAGLREVESEIERESIRRAESWAQKAELGIYVIDASVPLHPEDRVNLNRLGTEKAIVVLNKSDLGTAVRPADIPGFVGISCSFLRGEGVSEIRDSLIRKLGITQSSVVSAAISERHRKILVDARKDIVEAKRILESGRDDELVLAACHLRDALETLGTATGKVYTEELLANVFSQFCIGK